MWDQNSLKGPVMGLKLFLCLAGSTPIVNITMKTTATVDGVPYVLGP